LEGAGKEQGKASTGVGTETQGLEQANNEVTGIVTKANNISLQETEGAVLTRGNTDASYCWSGAAVEYIPTWYP
jgi:hypothetical protein